MIKYFKSLLDCLWEIEKDLHTISSSVKAKENVEGKDVTKSLEDFISNHPHGWLQ